MNRIRGIEGKIMSNVLLVAIAGKNSILTTASNRGVMVCNPYSKNNFWVRNIRKISTKINIKLSDRFYNSNLKNIEEDIIVIFDSCITKEFLCWIKKNNPNKRIIFWYWNPVSKSIKPEKVPKGIELWSYSAADCSKYNLNYNTQFYFTEFQQQSISNERDIYFIGADKGRLKDILIYEKKFIENSLNVRFHITPTRWFLLWTNYVYEKPISYAEVLIEIAKSKAIFDYYLEDTSGLSLRPMEALFLRKKLITNNKNILNFDFYNKENIFVIGIDQMEDINVFLDKPYVNINKEVMNKYDFSTWLRNFEHNLGGDYNCGSVRDS